MEPRTFFLFDTMLTPRIIPFVYWLLLAGVLLSGVGLMFTNFMAGLLTLVVGAVMSRIWCELLIVLFKINENIQKIAGPK